MDTYLPIAIEIKEKMDSCRRGESGMGITVWSRDIYE
jgi:hypothetical protein